MSVEMHFIHMTNRKLDFLNWNQSLLCWPFLLCRTHSLCSWSEPHGNNEDWL